MDPDFAQNSAMVLSLAGLIPYFGWGIYTLRLHYRYHEDIKPSIASITLLFVALFYVIQVMLLRIFLDDQPAFFIFAVMGLFVSGAALYTNMVVSLLSQLLVDTIVPGERSKTNEPRYGSGEALERMGDYDGAIEEFLIIARIFPKEPKPLLHVADNYLKLEQPEQAVRWMERALRLIKDPDESLQVVNRVCSIYLRTLNQPMEAIRVLEDYLEKYSESDFTSVVETHIERIEHEMDTPPEPAITTIYTPIPVKEGEVALPILPSQQTGADVSPSENESHLEIPMLPDHPRQTDNDTPEPPKGNDLLPL